LDEEEERSFDEGDFDLIHELARKKDWVGICPGILSTDLSACPE
jgi:hypothetical protein